jgi:hypothetical protein
MKAMLKNEMHSIEVQKIWAAHQQLINCKGIVMIPHIKHNFIYKELAMFLG